MDLENDFFTKKNCFYKMHGTGNDFILVNGIGQVLSSKEQATSLAAKLCHRKFGIGADGLLIVRKIDDSYKMQVINSDGSLPNMCGNGLRCFASLLYNLKMITNNCEILTDDGIKSISIRQLPKQHAQSSKEYIVNLKIGRGGDIQEFKDKRFGKIYLTSIGVPHLIVFMTKEQFQTTDFQLEGKEFQKQHDANINFCRIDGNFSMAVKTYERGAGLTYSCGTGVSSSVYVAVKHQKVLSQAVMVKTDGGQIHIEITQELDVIMNGPARIICKGTFQD